MQLICGMGIQLALDNGFDDGKEVVIDLDSFKSQLAVVPFRANGRRLLGLKRLQC